MSQRVAVLGGGISGLAAAWNLARRQPNLDILLLERSEKFGGWLQSYRGGMEEEGERGGVFELGPRSLRTAGVAGKTTLALVRRGILFSPTYSHVFGPWCYYKVVYCKLSCLYCKLPSLHYYLVYTVNKVAYIKHHFTTFCGT